jgi:hypothetical protein
MTRVLTALAFLASLTTVTITPADARTSCSWIGNYWVCNGDGGRSSCSRIGNYWVCN